MNHTITKISLYLAMLLLPFVSSAQFTLTQSHLPTVGLKTITVEDAFMVGFTTTAGSSTAQNWDYSAAFHNFDTLINSYIDPGTTPYDTMFANATLAQYDSASAIYVYFRKSTSGYYFDGLYTPSSTSPFKLDFVPDDLLLPVPFSFGNTKKDTSGFELLFNSGGTGIKVVQTIYSDFSADAFGTLKTPAQTYSNTMRVKKYSMYNTKVYVQFGSQYQQVDDYDSSSTDYSWYADQGSALVFQASADSSGDVKRASYLAGSNATSIKTPLRQFTLYPNPANGYTDISTENGIEQVTLYSTDGKIIKDIKPENAQNTYRLNTENLAAGVYYLSISTKDGNTYASQKLLIK